MTSPRTMYLALPAHPGAPGGLLIVSRRASCCLTLTDYRHAPDGWAEVGTVGGYAGRLFCLDAPSHVHAALLACQPLVAPLVMCFADEVAA